MTMARVEFQASLDSLEATLQEQGAVVIRALRGAVDVLSSQDIELCDEVGCCVKAGTASQRDLSGGVERYECRAT